jgi:hypothetical protein
MSVLNPEEIKFFLSHCAEFIQSDKYWCPVMEFLKNQHENYQNAYRNMEENELDFLRIC